MFIESSDAFTGNCNVSINRNENKFNSEGLSKPLTGRAAIIALHKIRPSVPVRLCDCVCKVRQLKLILLQSYKMLLQNLQKKKYKNNKNNIRHMQIANGCVRQFQPSYLSHPHPQWWCWYSHWTPVTNRQTDMNQLINIVV